MNRNPNCDGGHCAADTGETRVLPTGPQSNAIPCRACFVRELEWRRERNKNLKRKAFDLPAWESLDVYLGAQ